MRLLSSRLNEVLLIGAHCDDIEIGCGGLLLQLRAAYPELLIRAIVFSSDPAREMESRDALRALIGGGDRSELAFHAYRDGYFPGQWIELKEVLSGIARAGSPDLIVTHWAGDAHQDHRLMSELTWTAFRDSMIMEYEIPKYDGDIGRPNIYVPLTEAEVARKLAVLLRCFPSQSSKYWFTEETFRAVLRLRGIEARSASGYAEAYYSRKSVLEFHAAQP